MCVPLVAVVAVVVAVAVVAVAVAVGSRRRHTHNLGPVRLAGIAADCTAVVVHKQPAADIPLQHHCRCGSSYLSPVPLAQ